jgi:Rad3-related DNA helicase
MWNLYEDEKKLKPLVFSNGKSQEDVIREVLEAIKQGNKIIFIKGMCGTGKSAIALNLARKLGRASIVVPIKSLQEQYTKDYTGKKYVLHNGKKLKIQPITGRQNFKCCYQKQSDKKIDLQTYYQEKDAKLTDLFLEKSTPNFSQKNETCDNIFLPCKIEIKEKNLHTIKDYIKQNPDIRLTDFDSIKDIKRMTIAPICPYYSPILPEDFEIKKFKDARKIKYQGLNNKKFTIYQRKPGCGFYDQYEAYANADVIIFNSMKYKLETLMDRKPATDVEIIDECDDFLDSFANKEQINLNRLLFGLSLVFPEDLEHQKIIDKLGDISNTIKRKYPDPTEEPINIKGTLIEELLEVILENTELLDKIETNESNYIYHLDQVARTFHDFLEETFFSIEKKDNDLILHLVTTNLAKKFKEIVEKNKVFVMMSGTIHSESVLKNIFGLEKFKVIEAEVEHQGDLIKCKHGYEMDCKYANFQSKKISREQYLKALSKTVDCAKKPTLVHVNAFADLPNIQERENLRLDNLPTQNELLQEQANDPLGKRINNFKNKKIPVFFTTKCNRGADFPGDICNSIIITRFPYPNISGIFWKILKKTNPQHFMSFYMDKARRELLQKIYRGLRSKDDRVYLLSPDVRVLDFKID